MQPEEIYRWTLAGVCFRQNDRVATRHAADARVQSERAGSHRRDDEELVSGFLRSQRRPQIEQIQAISRLASIYSEARVSERTRRRFGLFGVSSDTFFLSSSIVVSSIK
jgi:hypothetical protein